MVLAFLLGIFASILGSDLKFPEGLYTGLTIYLLFAIGLKGGGKLSTINLNEFIAPAAIAILMCISIPLYSYLILKYLGKFSKIDSAAIAAHYGSVSAVTFSEATAFLDFLQIPYEGFMPSMLAIMEIPAILISIFLVKFRMDEGQNDWKKLLHELFTGKGNILLMGGMLIGFISSKKGLEQIAPLFEVPFRGILVLFLLEVGLITGKKLSDLKKVGLFLIGFGIFIPLLNATFGIILAKYIGLSLGGSVIFGTLCASASYIAAPAAIRIALPEAIPTYYLTASLAITFPFNIILGLPLYLNITQYFFGV
jgi:hypothetical protein